MTSQCIKGVDYEGKPTINEYSWVRDIGQGAFAKVILSQKNMDFSKYAIKQLKKTNLQKNGRNDMDLYREIDVQKKLCHHNIVRLFEVIDDPAEDKLYMILDYCPNGEIMSFNEEKMAFVAPK